MLQVLSRGDVPCYGPEERRYFQDVYDHVVRVTDEIDTLRDLVSNVVDANLAAVSNRLNEVMKVLTAVATILLVMTVVTSFFGQNFTAFIPFDSAALFWGSIVFTVIPSSQPGSSTRIAFLMSCSAVTWKRASKSSPPRTRLGA